MVADNAADSLKLVTVAAVALPQVNVADEQPTQVVVTNSAALPVPPPAPPELDTWRKLVPSYANE